MRFQGDVYYWSKHREYLKFLDLPQRTSQKFELALSSFNDDDRRLLEERGGLPVAFRAEGLGK